MMALDTKDRLKLLRLIRETSVLTDEKASYQLASGRTSKHYVDCKRALSYPEARDLIGRLISQRMAADEFDAVGGLALGAYPIAVAVSDAVYRKSGRSIRAFVVRKEAKQHGLGRLLEGEVRKGDRALIVDDVITSGSSAIEAIDRARAEGLQVAKVIALIDRQEARGKENIEAKHVRFEALFMLREFLELPADDVNQGPNARVHTAGAVQG